MKYPTFVLALILESTNVSSIASNRVKRERERESHPWRPLRHLHAPWHLSYPWHPQLLGIRSLLSLASISSTSLSAAAEPPGSFPSALARSSTLALAPKPPSALAPSSATSLSFAPATWSASASFPAPAKSCCLQLPVGWESSAVAGGGGGGWWWGNDGERDVHVSLCATGCAPD
jgi:hypothetical protein